MFHLLTSRDTSVLSPHLLRVGTGVPKPRASLPATAFIPCGRVTGTTKSAQNYSLEVPEIQRLGEFHGAKLKVPAGLVPLEAPAPSSI